MVHCVLGHRTGDDLKIRGTVEEAFWDYAEIL